MDGGDVGVGVVGGGVLGTTAEKREFCGEIQS